MNYKIEQKFKKLRHSKNRDSIISILSGSKVPISIENIFYKVKGINNNISLSTVYRIMNKLIDIGIVRKSAKDGDTTLYELTKNGHHHYIICTKCKKMTILDSCPIAELEQKISEDTGYFITEHSYEIYGECKDCHNKK